MADMSESCPECGASASDGMTCWELLGNILAWEWHDPELQSEHFLTVASYNLQHPAQFTDESIRGLQVALVQHMTKGVPVAIIRQQNARAHQGRKRVLKPAAERVPVLRHWPQTVADVYAHDQPLGAAARVRDWAASIQHALSG